MTADPTSPHWIVGPILLPLLAAALAFAAPPRARPWLAAAGVLGALLTAALLAAHLPAAGPLHYRVGGWPSPLGVLLVADGLSLTLVLTTSAIVAAATSYAAAYLHPAPDAPGHPSAAPHFWPLWLFVCAALNAVFLAGDLFNAYVTLELLGLASVGLIALSGGPALGAGMRYLLVTLVGSMAYLMGVALLYAATGSLDLPAIAPALAASPQASLAVALVTAGLLLKTALFPLHFWLPPAHASALGPVSAVLSALVVKATFVLTLRLWHQAFPDLALPAARDLLGALGALAVLWGGLQALRQQRLKALVAYSTVAQVGYLFLAFPLLHGPGAADAWRGVVYLALAHAFAKSALFLAAGVILRVTGDDTVAALPGAAKRLPLTVFTIGLAGVSLMGLPPTSGFIGKWLLLTTAIAAERWWIAAVLVAGGLLTAAYMFRVLAKALLPAAAAVTRERLPPALGWSAFALALAGVALGLATSAPLGLIDIGAPPAVAEAVP